MTVRRYDEYRFVSCEDMRATEWRPLPDDGVVTREMMAGALSEVGAHFEVQLRKRSAGAPTEDVGRAAAVALLSCAAKIAADLGWDAEKFCEAAAAALSGAEEGAPKWG